MKELTNVQFIEQNGVPAFVVIPYDEYLKMVPQEKDDDDYIPNEVVELIVKKRFNLVKAWRSHRGLTQKEVAERAGITQAAVSQMEKSNNELRTGTLEKLAAALEVDIEQLKD